jgi:hypothetical protein
LNLTFLRVIPASGPIVCSKTARLSYLTIVHSIWVD